MYCTGLDQARAVKHELDTDLKEVFSKNTTSTIKRGCSEYPLKFPNYGKIPKKSKAMMKYPSKWKPIEKQADQIELIGPNQVIKASLPNYCLSDFYIFHKWIDYAKVLEDKSVENFCDIPIIFTDIYKQAQIRA